MGQAAGLGVGAAAARHHRSSASFPGSVMSRPGKNRIVSSMAIEKKIVSYALPRNGSERSEERSHPR